MRIFGGFFKTHKALSEAEVEDIRKKWEDAYTGPIPRGFGIGETGPEIIWPAGIEVTCLNDEVRRFVPDSRRHAGYIPPCPPPPPPPSRRAPLGRCASCGSSEWIKRNGQTVCSYCRGAA